MSERDAWSGIPNLSGLTAARTEGTREGDPSRFYASGRTGIDDVVSARILDQPRCRIWDSVGEVGHGPGAAATTFNSIVYDEDGMFETGGARISTPGLYTCTGGLLYSTGTGPRQSYFVCAGVSYGITTTANVAGGIQHNIKDEILCKAGDLIQLFANTVTDASNILGGISSKYLSVCRISTHGSD